MRNRQMKHPEKYPLRKVIKRSVLGESVRIEMAAIQVMVQRQQQISLIIICLEHSEKFGEREYSSQYCNHEKKSDSSGNRSRHHRPDFGVFSAGNRLIHGD